MYRIFLLSNLVLACRVCFSVIVIENVCIFANVFTVNILRQYFKQENRNENRFPRFCWIFYQLLNRACTYAHTWKNFNEFWNFSFNQMYSTRLYFVHNYSDGKTSSTKRPIFDRIMPRNVEKKRFKSVTCAIIYNLKLSETHRKFHREHPRFIFQRS